MKDKVYAQTTANQCQNTTQTEHIKALVPTDDKSHVVGPTVPD